MHKKLYEILCEAEEIAAKRCDFAEKCDDCPADNKGFECFEWITVDSLMNLGVTIPVRCKDCRYYDPTGDYCGCWGGVRHPEHYCGEGDPKNATD